SQILVCTGGLGPTTDDLTAEAVAVAVGVPLERDAASLEHIRRRIEKFGRTLNASNAKQADFPRGAEILPNPLGTAPGFATAIGGATAVFLPRGPPPVMRLFEDQALPRLPPLPPNRPHQ